MLTSGMALTALLGIACDYSSRLCLMIDQSTFANTCAQSWQPKSDVANAVFLNFNQKSRQQADLAQTLLIFEFPLSECDKQP